MPPNMKENQMLQYIATQVVVLVSTCIFLNTRCVSSTNIDGDIPFMSQEERLSLKEEAREMFYHGYRAYMDNAYPADELMPLSCAGRYRGLAPNRGDMDDILGNFSLTLIDTLDTLVILGDVDEFERAVKLIIKDVTFDNDIVVSVFETNIRILGGLLSGHILAEYLKERSNRLSWYRGELLDMAKDVGYRLLPAFNTTTGIPHARVNLRHGLKSNHLESMRETCTACAGTMILEMAALSRLTGEPVFEDKAHKAMDQLWNMRHRTSELMGSILNIYSGDWVRRDSGVGAGIDSYYEYCLKAYILLGDERYLHRFNRHYSAIMKYVSQGPLLLDVHMHRPHTNSKNFMDALLAFWPGLQVLKGDIKPAVETHEMLYQVMKRHNFIPEAFTTDFQVHWGQHPLRPEFLESTYFLHRATNDPYYLDVGKNVLESLQKHARVSCGYAAVNDVRTGKHEDRMDSFVLAETFKYLFLLFAEDNEFLLDLNDFIFTTEAHLLPLSLAYHNNSFSTSNTQPHANSLETDLQLSSFRTFSKTDSFKVAEDYSRTCPNTKHILPESVRKPLRNMVDGVCPKFGTSSYLKRKRRLTAAEFQITDQSHLAIVKDMGITIFSLNDGRIQLLHSFANARSTADAEEGLILMQEMVELSKSRVDQPDADPQGVFFTNDNGTPYLITAGPSHFGVELRGHNRVSGQLAIAKPLQACTKLDNADAVRGKLVFMVRGDCMFIQKARIIQEAGAIGGIVMDNVLGTTATTSPFFAMSGDGTDDVTIPIVFLFREDTYHLMLITSDNPNITVTIGQFESFYYTIPRNTELIGANQKLLHRLYSEKQRKLLDKSDELIMPDLQSNAKIEVSIGDFYGFYLNDMIVIEYRKNVNVSNLLFEVDDDDEQVETPTPPSIMDKLRVLWKTTKFVYLTSLIEAPTRRLVMRYAMFAQIYVKYHLLRDYSQITALRNRQDLIKQLTWFLKEMQKLLNSNPVLYAQLDNVPAKNDKIPKHDDSDDLASLQEQLSDHLMNINTLLLETIAKLDDSRQKKYEHKDELVVVDDPNIYGNNVKQVNDDVNNVNSKRLKLEREQLQTSEFAHRDENIAIVEGTFTVNNESGASNSENESVTKDEL